MRKAIRFAITFPLVLALGGAAVLGSLLLIVPAVHSFGAVVAGRTCGKHLELSPLAQRSYMFDRNGSLMQTLYSDEDREPVKFADIPQAVIQAVLATEDREFFAHSGVDLRGMARAFQRDVQNGSIREGGSTITQQLVKNTLFPNGRKRTAKDKLREAVLSACLEQQYTKQQILERYLNTVYFGQQAYGLKAASERYFGKPDVRTLTIPEAAMLAGMIQSPSRDPITHYAQARDRRLQVFQFMEETGAITAVEAQRYAQVPLPRRVAIAGSTQPSGHLGYYESSVMAYLTKGDNAAARALGTTPEARLRLLTHGGLRITTMYDPKLQSEAEAARDAEGLPPQMAVGMAVVENATGAVRAMLAGTDFHANQFNLATMASQQPGSGFKVFTLTTALENGYSPNDTVLGDGHCFFDTAMTGDNNGWNVSSDKVGVSNLRTMIAQSVNCGFARLILSLGHRDEGAKRVAEVANRLGTRDIEDVIGVTSLIEPALRKLVPVPTLTLGTSGVSPLDMAVGYSTIANDGVRHDPTFVAKIVGPDGTVLYNAPGTPGRPVLSAQVARTVTDMLRAVLTQGTARGYANLGRPAAGKTGTTNSNTTVTFTGYTPQYTASFMAYDQTCTRAIPQCSLMGYGGRRSPLPKGPNDAFGGHLCARMWTAFMQAALADQPVLDFTAPDPSLWPRAVYFDENGRRLSYSYGSGSGSSSSSGSGTNHRPHHTSTTTSPATKPSQPTVVRPATGSPTTGGP